MRILGYILIWGGIVLIAFGWASSVYGATPFWSESFEGYSQGTNVNNVLGFENSTYLDINQGSSFASDGAFGISNYLNTGGSIKYIPETPISEDFSIMFDYKFLQARGYFATLYLGENIGMNVFFNYDPAHHINFDDYSVGDFHTIRIDVEYDEGLLKFVSANVYVDDNFEADLNIYGGNLTEIGYFYYSMGNIVSAYTIAFDNFRVYEPPLPPSSIDITSPLAGTIHNEDFDIVGNYDMKEEEWDKIVIFFEEWDASSTCPLFGTPEWEIEKDLDWFHYGSIGYHSDILSSSAGYFSIPIQGLISGNFNCIDCHFFNIDLQLFSPEKCQGYNLIYGEIIPEVPPVPFSAWTDYYNSISEKFASSTPLFNTITGSFTPIINKMVNFTLFVKEYFDVEEATSKGEDLGEAIPKARGYLEMIDDFIGLPLSGLIIFYLLTTAVVVSYKVILTIIKLLKP